MTTLSQLFQTIRRIQITSTQLADDVLAGEYRSAFRGQGIEFEEVRGYQPGDEMRSIDWNVTARMGHPYVKTFREERELTVLLVVDVSASSRFGSRQESKATLMAEIGAALAFSAIKNQDKVGLVLFSSTVEKYIPPRKGTRHVLRVIRELLAFEPKERGSNLQGALAFVGKVQRRAAICFVLSDFLCPDFSHDAMLLSKRHDLIAIRLTDPYEHKFPAIPLVTLTDLESGKQGLFDTSDPQLQEHFEKQAATRTQTLKRLSQQLKAGWIEVSTDKPYLPALRGFFKQRARQRR